MNLATLLPPFVADDSPDLEVTIPGHPVGASRPTVTCYGAHYSRSHVQWERVAVQVVALTWRGRAPMEGPVSVEIEIVQRRPRSLCRRKDPPHRIPACCKPDIDNVAKLVLDALTKARIWRDDTQVCELSARKWYAAIEPDEAERVVVRGKAQDAWTQRRAGR